MLIAMTNNPDSNKLKITREKGVDAPLTLARAALRPTVQAAISLKEYVENFGDLDLTSLVEALTEQTTKTNDGNMARAEAMLTAQAHTLDAIFNNLAQRAINTEYMNHLDCCLKLALRAQSQSRATWEALSAIQNPPLAGYVKQANIAHGPQQVNNGPDPESGVSRTGERENPQNKLLEKNDGQWLETGTTRTASGTDQEMATVGTVDRPKDK